LPLLVLSLSWAKRLFLVQNGAKEARFSTPPRKLHITLGINCRRDEARGALRSRLRSTLALVAALTLAGDAFPARLALPAAENIISFKSN
jgi:hypothetical protein